MGGWRPFDFKNLTQRLLPSLSCHCLPSVLAAAGRQAADPRQAAALTCCPCSHRVWNLQLRPVHHEAEAVTVLLTLALIYSHGCGPSSKGTPGAKMVGGWRAFKCGHQPPKPRLFRWQDAEANLRGPWLPLRAFYKLFLPFHFIRSL